jgi:tyrosyl-tRNA synthetase
LTLVCAAGQHSRWISIGPSRFMPDQRWHRIGIYAASAFATHSRVMVTMDEFKGDFLRTLSERGYIHQVTEAAELDSLSSSTVLSAYIGFDATADSLHIGSLVQIMLLRRLQQAGHRPIVLMGGGTTKVGDPSGRDETRQLLSEQQINANIASIREIFARFLRFDDSPTGAVMVNNDDWLGGLQYIAFLRDVGRHFTINRMLTMDSVKLRLEREQPLTFLEFNYMIMQGYDFVELFKRQGCRLQMGGSDQWGNIVQGVELGRRMADAHLFGLTSPLIKTASGTKMGKTASGAVWLNPKRLSAYDYWQFWRNAEDGDVGRFLRLFTDLPLQEIARLEQLKDADINEAKKILANEATRLCHGDEAAKQALQTATSAFAGQQAAGLPTFNMQGSESVSVIDVIIGLHMASSKTEARRLIEQGGVKLNDQPVLAATAQIKAQDFREQPVLRIAVGKKRHGLVQAT